MAVSTATPLPPSQPDIAKLNTFTGWTVTVTKHLAARNTVGTMVVPTQHMRSVNQVLDLMTSVPLVNGPGFYKFTVVDTGGQGENEWLVKLGPDLPEVPMAGPTGIVPPAAGPSASVPLDENVKQIAPGWFHNEALGLITTPWRETVPWQPGQPMPKPPAASNQQQMSSSPWPQSSWAGPGGWGTAPGAWAPWGTIPATDDGTKTQLEATQRQLEAAERRAEQDRRDREQREREQALREEMRREREATEARFEKLFQAITAKPEGPSAAEQRMERELAEERRRREESDREAQRREEARLAEERRREEMRVSEERHREEMRLVRDEVRSANANRVDPVMTLFGQILTTQTTNAAQTIQMIRDTAAASSAAAERSSTQILELARSQRDGSVEASRGMVDGMKNLMDTQREVFTNLLELRGSDGAPWYADVAREALGQMSQIGAAIASARAQQPQQPQYIPPAAQQQRQPQQRRPQTASAAAARTVPATQPIPRVGAPPPGAQVHTGDRPAGTMHDAKTDEFILANGARIKADLVREKGWANALNEVQQHVANRAAADAAMAATAPEPVQAAPANGTNGVAHAPAVAPAARRKKAPRKPSRRKTAPAAAAAEQQGYTIEQIRDMPVDDVRQAAAQYTEEQFFGPILQLVQQKRQEVANGLSAEEYANTLLGARQYLTTLGQRPVAVELLYAEQFEVLVERLLPQADEEYREEVVDVLQTTIDEESGRGSDEDEGEEGEEAGAEA